MYDEQASGTCPKELNGVVNVALSVAYTISAIPNMVTAIPTAGPLTRTMRGFLRSIYDATYFLNRQHLIRYFWDMIRTFK